MAFRQEDFKKTSRKSAGAAPAAIYPHQLKDKKTLARLEIAIRTFDMAAGKRRRDMDAQAMTDFFGDPRLARGIVACLGQFYKYETPDFAQTVGRDAASRLRSAGLSRPVDLRAATYAHVNEHHNGFLTEAGRAQRYGELGERFCLTAHQWDTLLHLDAEDNQILTRLGAVPAPADIVALYNFHSLDTVLRRAAQITLTGLSLSPGDASDVRALAKALGVRAVVSGDGAAVRMEEPTPGAFIPTPGASADPSLLGKGEERAGTSPAPTGLSFPTPPSLGVIGVTGKGAGGLGSPSSLFPRRAGRLARCLLYLVQIYGTRTTTGFADAKIGTRSFRLMLGTEALRALGMPRIGTPRIGMPRVASAPSVSFRRRFEAGLVLHKDLLKKRARGETNGWRIKRLPDPIVGVTGVLLADFTLTRDGQTVSVVIGNPIPAHKFATLPWRNCTRPEGRGLGKGAGPASAPALPFEGRGRPGTNVNGPGIGHGPSVLTLPLGRKPLDAGELIARVEAETGGLFALPPAAPPAVPADVRALCDRAAGEGLVRAADARRTLHLLDESPLIEWVRLAADPRVRYVPGVGLCSQNLVAAILGESGPSS